MQMKVFNESLFSRNAANQIILIEIPQTLIQITASKKNLLKGGYYNVLFPYSCIVTSLLILLIVVYRGRWTAHATHIKHFMPSLQISVLYITSLKVNIKGIGVLLEP